MRPREHISARRRIAGLSLIELLVAIVLLAILGAGFMAMYGDVTRHNAAGEQAAPMTWVAQGVMESELLYTEFGPPNEPPPVSNAKFGPYVANATVATAATKTVGGKKKPITYYAYLVTVTVTCASGACTPMVLTSYVYTT
ncbi:prepilin-type N-terminal cleavage/methylation domain-containing protein [Acidiferrobacter sp.]|uniref:PulJ/GspJ family protein n=1 Tax=Acidiferrobacter sp. TaxID=1872107 RepID=UPI002601B400|nr:prepilin-type N-terminal cleavage/methylation domain-containing protein [Acidiferrobacter sp.]